MWKIKAMFFGGLVLSSSIGFAQEYSKLTLEDAKRVAVANNREVQALRRGVEEAKAKAGRTRSTFYPRIGVAGGVDSQIAADDNESAPVGYFYANYNLFNGFRDTYRREIANLDAEKSEFALKHQELLAGLEVEKYFHEFLFVQTSIALKNEALRTNDNLASAARKRKTAGLGSDADILEFDFRDALLKSDLTILDQKLEEVRIGLRKTLGEEVGSKIEPVGVLQHQHIVGDLMVYLDQLKSANPILKVSARELAIAELESKNWRSRWLPTIDFESRAGYLELDRRPADGGSAMNLLVIAKMDLFSGFETSWERSEGIAKKARAEEELKANLVNLVSDVERYYRRIKAIERSVDLEEQNESRAKKYYETVKREYQAGIKNSNDVKAAADLSFEASLRRVKYKLEFLSEKIEMEKLLGSPVKVEIIAESGAGGANETEQK
jgi:outer membrane protein TolC